MNGKSFEKKLKKIQSAAEKALDQLGVDKGGRPDRMEIRKLIINLKAIYEDSTGKKAGTSYDNYKNEFRGPFFFFVHSIIKKIDSNEIYSNSSLGQQIKQALKMADSHPKPNFDRIPTIFPTLRVKTPH